MRWPVQLCPRRTAFRQRRANAFGPLKCSIEARPQSVCQEVPESKVAKPQSAGGSVSFRLLRFLRGVVRCQRPHLGAEIIGENSELNLDGRRSKAGELGRPFVFVRQERGFESLGQMPVIGCDFLAADELAPVNGQLKFNALALRQQAANFELFLFLSGRFGPLQGRAEIGQAEISKPVRYLGGFNAGEPALDRAAVQAGGLRETVAGE